MVNWVAEYVPIFFSGNNLEYRSIGYTFIGSSLKYVLINLMHKLEKAQKSTYIFFIISKRQLNLTITICINRKL